MGHIVHENCLKTGRVFVLDYLTNPCLMHWGDRLTVNHDSRGYP